MDSSLCIIKLGGSSITDKSKLETLNSTALENCADFIASAYTKFGRRFCVIHGAGSFGHQHAKTAGLCGQTLPPLPPDESGESLEDSRRADLLRGLASTRRSVLLLNHAVTSALVDAGLPAVGISPFSTGGPWTDGGSKVLVRPIADAISAGLLPVVHGDVILYGSPGSDSPAAGILSGDTILSLLATDPSLAGFVSDAVFLTDVDGVHAADPRKDPSASLIPEVRVDRDGRVVTNGIDASASGHGHDVTGGLAAKLGAAAEVARGGVPVVVVRCGSAAAEAAILGKFLTGREAENREEGDKDKLSLRGTVVRLQE
mmetsp:Transcript_46762/g.91289  ORF Transcript_46762/g.91289 Transcript_46762/m.91289 type:complete len:316 (+) Transcript_46762:30-977(+)